MKDFKNLLDKLSTGQHIRTVALREGYNKKIETNPLSIDIKNNLHLVNAFKDIKSEETKKVRQRSLYEVSTLIAFCLNITSIDEITPDSWLELLDQIKTPNFRFYSFVPERLHPAFKMIGSIISQLTGDHFFRDYAKVQRGGNIKLFSESVGLSAGENKWRDLFLKWIDEELHVKSSKKQLASAVTFMDYLNSFDEKKIDPLVFLSKQRSKVILDYYKKKYPQSFTTHLSYLYRFTLWIVEEQMSEEDDEGGLVHIGYPIITTYQYEQLQNKTAIRQPETTQVKIPTSFLIAIEDILTKNDYEFPKSLSNQYFDWFNPDTNQLESIWSPVQTYVYLTMLEIPIRKVQVQMLDSGEGDDERYNPQTKQWENNTSSNSKYWLNISAIKPQRGVITKIEEGIRESAGLYISTNKTKDISVGFGPESGYTIPWNNESLINKLDTLRTWQEKYYPVNGPLSYEKLLNGATSDSKPSKSVLEQTPSRFYLFRCPISGTIGSPATANTLMRFWWEIMEKLEEHLKEIGEDVTIIMKRNELTNQVERTIFNPHGLRVSGLTSLAEAGVPIEVLSKIVAGHSSILMTIYYLKYSDGYITETLNKARREVEDNAKTDLKNWLKDATYEEAKRYMVASNESGLKAFVENKALSAIWGGSSLGICPNGATRCDDGGPQIKKPTSKNNGKFGPVPGGHGNCMRCRHFVTGLPWLIDLWLHGNKLLESISFQSNEINVLCEVQKVLTKQRYAFVKNKQQHLITSDLVIKIKNNDAIIETKSNQLEETINNVHATYNYIKDVRSLKLSFSNDKSLENLPATVDDELGINFIDSTDFNIKNLLVQASRAYPEIADKRVEMERNHFVDQILVNNGLPPISFSPLTLEEKQASTDAMASFLLSKVGANECENLNKGLITIRELGLEKSVQEVIDSKPKKMLD